MWPDGYGVPNLFSCFRWIVCSFFFFPLESEAMRLPISGSPSKCIPNLLILNVLNSCPSKPQTFFLCNYQLGFYIEEVISGSDKLDVLYIHFMPLSDSISSYCNSKRTTAELCHILKATKSCLVCLLLLSRCKCGNLFNY